MICYGLVDWLIRYPMTAVVTVVFTSCPTRGGQQRNQFIRNFRTKDFIPSKVYTDEGSINTIVCPPVRDIIHSLKIVDYFLVQEDKPWYNYYIKLQSKLSCTLVNALHPWKIIFKSKTLFSWLRTSLSVC